MNARTARLAAAALAASAGLVTLASGAGANNQVLTATVGDSIVASVSNANVEFGKLAIGTNLIPKTSAGTLRVQSNVPYTVTVMGTKAAMTKYENGTYTDATMLAPLTMTTSSTHLDAVPATIPATVSNTVPAVVAAGIGIVSNDHTYDLSFIQAVAPATPWGTYRNVLTYTTTATL